MNSASMMSESKTMTYKKKLVFHDSLREEYADVLPQRMRENATERQIDAFQLYLLAMDLNHARKNPACFYLPTDCRGRVIAVKFRGNYYKFDADHTLLAQIIN